MEHEYGEDAAREALRHAHSQTLKELLATPLPDTLNDVEAFARSKQADIADALEFVDASANRAMPRLSKPEAEHFRVDLETLRALIRR
jgi:hypothetical protein